MGTLVWIPARHAYLYKVGDVFVYTLVVFVCATAHDTCGKLAITIYIWIDMMRL